MGFRGPFVTLRYAPNAVERVAMVAGGTGITPMFQIIRAALADPADRTALCLLYACRSPRDLLLRRARARAAAASRATVVVTRGGVKARRPIRARTTSSISIAFIEGAGH